MTNIKINFNNKELHISESFAKKASAYGSVAYNELMDVQTKHPMFTVKVQKNKSKKSVSVKGISREFMYEYALNHDKNNSAADFEKLKAENASYLAVKATFLKHYPEFKNFKTKTEWILAA